jgi:hypothetical protein
MKYPAWPEHFILDYAVNILPSSLRSCAVNTVFFTRGMTWQKKEFFQWQPALLTSMIA